MDSWKKALVMGSIGAAALLFLKKRYPAGVLATGIGLAVVASEYPDKFETVRRSLPGKDCGACGAPTCAALAEDVVLARADATLCPYRSTDGG